MKEAGVDLDTLGKKAGEAKQKMSIFADTYKAFLAVQATIAVAQRLYNRIVGDSVELYKEQVKALSNLRTVLGYTSTSLLTQSKILSEQTAIDDETIVTIYSVIGAFTKEESVIKRLTPAILDFAKAHKDMSPETAAQLFTKAVFSSTDALSRYAIKLDGAVGSEERINDAIKKSTALWGGLSQAFAKTDVGSLQGIQIKIDNIKKTIGQKIIPYQVEWNELILKAYTFLNKILSLMDTKGYSKEEQKQYKQIFDVIPNIEDTQKRKEAYLKVLSDLQKEEKDIQNKLKITTQIAPSTGEQWATRLKSEEKIEKDVLENRLKTIKEYQNKINEEVKPRTPVTVPPAGDPEKKKQEIQVRDLRLFEEKIKSILLDIEEDYRTNRKNLEQYYDSLLARTKDLYEGQIRAAEEYKNKLIKVGEDKDKIEKAEMDIMVKQAEMNNKLKEIRIEKAKAIDKETEAIKKLQEAAIEDLKTERERANIEASKINLSPEKKGIDKELQDIKNKYDNNIKVFNDLQLLYEKDSEEYKKAEQSKLTATQLYLAEKAEIEKKYSDEEKQRIQEASLYITKTLLSAWSTYFDVRLNNLEKQKNSEINYTKSTITDKEKQQKAIEQINARYEAEARKMAEKKRKIAIIEATIDMFASAVAAYRAFMGIDIIGPALGAAAAAAALAFGAMKITAIASAQYFEGGKVSGRQGRDKVNAKLTVGEYVQSKPAVDYYGEGAMEALNKRLIPKNLFRNYSGLLPSFPGRFLNSGGMVSSRDKETTLQINNIVDSNLIGHYINSSAGQDVILNVISNNQYTIKRNLQL